MSSSSSDNLPRTDGRAALYWRWCGRIDRRMVDAALRFAPGLLRQPLRPRLAAMGLPDEVVDAAMARATRLEAWPEAWMWAAQRLFAEARQEERAHRPLEAALARRHAALAYHVAAWLPPEDEGKTLRALRSTSASLFSAALPALDPAAQRLELPWRSRRLPGYLVPPPGIGEPAPLVVLLNGVTTAKEETFLWAEAFLWRGMAVLALDWPGTGEAALSTPAVADCEDVAEAALALAVAHDGLDPARVALVGVSLGGALAVRAAASDRRLAATVAVTPPFDARRWLDRASPVLREHLRAHAGGVPVEALADAFALPKAAARLRGPLLVFGSGRDAIVPPGEAIALAAAAGDWATLIWRPTSGHAQFDAIPQWTAEAAEWLQRVLPGFDPVHPGG